MDEAEFRLIVNGAERRVTCEPGTPLLDVLRNDLGLAGPKFGCGMGLCGACFVVIEGRARASCDLPVSAVGVAARRMWSGNRQLLGEGEVISLAIPPVLGGDHSVHRPGQADPFSLAGLAQRGPCRADRGERALLGVTAGKTCARFGKSRR
jgi:2Fe-2S iron-sulfur cluster binding domain